MHMHSKGLGGEVFHGCAGPQEAICGYPSRGKKFTVASILEKTPPLTQFLVGNNPSFFAVGEPGDNVLPWRSIFRKPKP